MSEELKFQEYSHDPYLSGNQDKKDCRPVKDLTIKGKIKLDLKKLRQILEDTA